MEWANCNGCGHLPNCAGFDSRRYYLSQCGHFVCFNCARTDTGLLRDVCKICQNSCRLVEVNQNASPDIVAYFKDPISVIEESIKKYRRIEQFQKQQAKYYCAVLNRVLDAHRKGVAEGEELKRQINEAKSENSRLKQEAAEIRGAMNNLLSEVQQLKRLQGSGSGVTVNNKKVGFEINNNHPPPSFQGFFGAGAAATPAPRSAVYPLFETGSTSASYRNALLRTPSDAGTSPSRLFKTPSTTSTKVSDGSQGRRTPSTTTPFSHIGIGTRNSPGIGTRRIPTPGSGSGRSRMTEVGQQELAARLRSLRCSASAQYTS